MNTELARRLRTAGVLIAVFLSLFIAGIYSVIARQVLSSVFLLITCLCAWELFGLVRRGESTIFSLLKILPSFIVPWTAFNEFFWERGYVGTGTFFLQETTQLYQKAVIATLLCSSVIVLALSRTDRSTLFENVFLLFFSFLFLGAGCGAVFALLPWCGGLLWLCWVVGINDAAAYFAGKKWGKTKLAPALSPGKTLIGSGAGLIAGTLTGVLFAALFPGITFQMIGTQHATLSALLYAPGVIIAAQLFDLIKSVLKREKGVKDSGTLLPGHGGVVDRIDGIVGGAIALLLFIQ